MSGLELYPAGDAAFMVDVGKEIDPLINRRVRAIAARVTARLAEQARVDVTPAYATFMVSFDPAVVAAEVVEAAIRDAAGEDVPAPADHRRFTLSVSYGGEHGPDLAELAGMHGISSDEVIARHSGRDYPIYCLGFSPGFPFLGGLEPSLHTPRLETPRPRVPAGSVAIGGSQTGVYPTETPGGWRLIGRTPCTLFDVRRTPPVPYEPGDVIRFEPISPQEYHEQLALQRMPVGSTIET